MYDTIIVGAGAAGLTTAIYAARRNLKTLVLSKDIGGQTATATQIENYPGVLDQPNGFTLMQNFKKQAESFGAEIKYGVVFGIKKVKEFFQVNTDRNSYSTKTVILAFGLTPRELGVPGEDKFKGKGVAYCATCDAPLFKDKVVAVVGGGNSALDAADLLSGIAQKAYLIHRRDEFTSEAVLQQKVEQAQNIERVLNSEIVKIKGGKKVESIIIKNNQSSQMKEVEVDGIFVEIGYEAKTAWLKGLVKLNERGEIITDENCRTSVPGVFAAGDVTDAPYKQIVISAGEGAKAALQTFKFIQQEEDLNEVPDWGHEKKTKNEI